LVPQQTSLPTRWPRRWIYDTTRGCFRSPFGFFILAGKKPRGPTASFTSENWLKMFNEPGSVKQDQSTDSENIFCK
jgi:hypothetical protein